MSHPQVPHPHDLLDEATRWSDRFLDWVTDHLLASPIIFYAAFTLPLLVLPMSDSVKLALSVISGSWFQWWALPALQRRQNQADVKRDAKADADHQALTHVALTSDEIHRMVAELHALHVDGRHPDRAQ